MYLSTPSTEYQIMRLKLQGKSRARISMNPKFTKKIPPKNLKIPNKSHNKSKIPKFGAPNFMMKYV